MTEHLRTGLPLEAAIAPEAIGRSVDGVGKDAAGAAAHARARRLLLAAIMAIGVLLASRGITNEGSVSLQGDMARYLMNGVFLYDYLKSGSDWTISGMFAFAEHYYAKYPALSLGHHPPLLPVAIMPAYAVFGVSVFWSRIVVLGFFLLAIGALFSVARRLYDTRVAVLAALLFATNGAVVSFGQVVMSEIPMIALVLLAMNALVRFRDSRRTRDYAWFIVLAAASLYAKQLAIFLVPVYVLFLLVFVPWRRLLERDVILLTLFGVVLCIPIAVITWVLSPFNVALVRFVSTQSSHLSPQPSVLWAIATGHLTMPMLIAVAAGAILSMAQRDRRVMVSLAWMASALLAVMMTTGRVDPPHYGMVAVPAYFLAAAGSVAVLRSPASRRIAMTLLALCAGWQVWSGRHVRPPGAEGYEAAAQYVLTHEPSPTILFSGPVDTGYFVFFVRKHDPLGQRVVLRADKIFTTSRMGRTSIEDRIKDRQEIYALLRTYGTRYVVIEDVPIGSRILEWLREEVRTSRFIERARIPIQSTDRRLRGQSLAIYEYRDAQPPDPDARLILNVPLVGREVRVPLADLIDFNRQ
jgi:hypothetical protein